MNSNNRLWRWLGLIFVLSFGALGYLGWQIYLEAWASIGKGLWYARSPEVIHSGVMETLVWLRVPGDIVFAGGAAILALYALRLLRRPTAQRTPGIVAPAGAE